MSYIRLAKEAGKQTRKLTIAQLKKLDSVYADVIQSLTRDIARMPLDSFWAARQAYELRKFRLHLAQEISNATKDGIEKATAIGAEVNEKAIREIMGKAGITIKPSFHSLFNPIRSEMIEDIISGGLYKDGKSLSARIWNFTGKNQQDLQHMILKSIAEGKSAADLSSDLLEYVKHPKRRFTDWGKVYPRLSGVNAEYNAMRLARTSINHAYQGSTIKSSALNPFVKGILWQSDMGHRTCELCKERHGKIYPVDDVPLDHPNGLCVMIPHVPDSFDKMAGSLRNWLDGEENTILDDWFAKHGDHFAYKTKFNTYNK